MGFDLRIENNINGIMKAIAGGAEKQRKAAALHVMQKIKAKAVAMSKSGNLAKGVYVFHQKTQSNVGLHAPAYHNYLIEFGHYIGKKGLSNRKFAPAHPIVYPTFREEADAVENILSQPWVE